MLFNKADILIPKNCDLTKWSVVACDQYTSEPQYWQRVEKTVGDAPSTLKLVYPEAFLSQGEERIEKINAQMNEYIREGLFKEYPQSLVYTERTLPGGRVRRGIVGAVDLEEYDYTKGAKSAVRATEGTVLSRIPPRVKIRENAPLELPHILLLINDSGRTVIEDAKKGEKLYDFDLMENGGHLCGWHMSGETADDFLKNFESFSKNCADNLVIAVGDGNHSLATAKQCWENLKKGLTAKERENHPARYCLAELENIHDSVLMFEPIHRVVFNVSERDFTKKIKEALSLGESGDEAYAIEILSNGKSEKLYIHNAKSPLAVGEVQRFLDENRCEVDYIHGTDVTARLAKESGTVGILLPKPDKNSLFETVIRDGALPRKTFSMGEANEKRFYMEAKRIN